MATSEHAVPDRVRARMLFAELAELGPEEPRRQRIRVFSYRHGTPSRYPRRPLVEGVWPVATQARAAMHVGAGE